MVTIGEKSQINVVAIKLQVPLNLVAIFRATANRILTIDKIAGKKTSAIKAGRLAFAEMLIYQCFSK